MIKNKQYIIKKINNIPCWAKPLLGLLAIPVLIIIVPIIFIICVGMVFYDGAEEIILGILGEKTEE